MSIVTTFNLSITSGDGQGGSSVALNKPVPSLQFAGISESYVQPQLIGVYPPAVAPVCTPGTGGSMVSGNYLVKVTYVNAPQGESLPSPESTTQAVASSGTLKVKSPAASAPATAYNVYITAAGGGTGTETKQNSTPIPIGQDYTQSAAVTSGAALPGTNSTLTFAPSLPSLPVQALHIRNLSVGVAAPSQPTGLTPGTGGSMLAGGYYVRTSYVTALGETLASIDSALQTVASTGTLTVPSPAAIPGAVTFNVYITAVNGAQGTETLQGSQTIGVNYVQSAAVAVGAALPTINGTVQLVSVSWTKQGGSTQNVLDLVGNPNSNGLGSALDFLEIVAGTTGGSSPSPAGGVTAISIIVSAPQSLIEQLYGA